MDQTAEDIDPEISRLSRRLERERDARSEAEAIAEKGLRELYENQQQLLLLERIATEANRTNSIEGVLRFTVAEICQFTGWEVGHSYLTVGLPDAPYLRSTGLWYAEDSERFREFQRVTEETDFHPGIGLPGRTLAAGKPVWTIDLTITDDAKFPRLPIARRCSLRGGIAFPVHSGSDIVAVLEFFSRIPREPSEKLLNLLAQVGRQLGLAIERRRAEDRLRDRAAELARARDAADAANNAKSAFLASMSHELRTPLNAIIGFSEMIRDALIGPVEPRYRDYASDIYGAGRHLQEIIDHVFDMSKVESGSLELHDDVVSLGDTVEMCRQLMATAAERAGVELSVDLPDALPLLRADAARIRQILLNLLSNAVKFTPAGGRVGVAAAIEADGIVVTVADTGIGMTPEDIAIAFEPFRQVDDVLSRRYEGTGLGLPLARALAELHGGRLEIESTPGLSTTVRLWLPRERTIDAA